AIAGVELKQKGVRRNKLARGFLAAIDETEFAKRLAAAMKPKIQAELMRGVRLISGRNHEAIGLHGAVNARSVAPHDQASRGQPRRLAVAQGFRAFPSLREQRL